MCDLLFRMSLQHKANITHVAKEQLSPFEVAVKKNNIEVVQLLMDSKCSAAQLAVGEHAPALTKVIFLFLCFYFFIYFFFGALFYISCQSVELYLETCETFMCCHAYHNLLFVGRVCVSHKKLTSNKLKQKNKKS